MSIRLSSLFVCFALLCAAAPVPAQESLVGVWRNTLNTVHLKVSPCGDALCATVSWASDEQRALARKGSGREMVGRQLLTGLRRGGDGKWRGKAFIPSINMNASATVIQVNGHTMRVTGCALLGVLCKTQHWHRLK